MLKNGVCSRVRSVRYEVGAITELAAYTGLRLGEALGLPWGKVDLDSGVLIVTQVCEQCSDRRGKPYARIRPYPKTRSSVRDVTLPPQTVGLLRRCKADYNARLLAAGLTASPEHLVFPNKNLSHERRGLPWDPCAPWLPDEFRRGFIYASGRLACRALASRISAARRTAHSWPMLASRFKSSSDCSGTHR
jgi:integrase